jgi:hypothetical protein
MRDLLYGGQAALMIANDSRLAEIHHAATRISVITLFYLELPCTYIRCLIRRGATSS